MILNVCPNPSVDSYAWLEEIKHRGVNRIEKIQEFPGGKGVHVALAIAELGGSSALMANWAGSNGDWIRKNSEQKKVKISGISLNGNNRKCYTFRSRKEDFNNTEIIEPGPILETEKWEEFKECFKKEISEVNLICLSGSWPLKAPKDASFQLVKIAGEQNKKLILDCSGAQLEEALKSSFFGLHLNEDEAEKLCGSSNLNSLLTKLDNSVELVALTRGKEGLAMWYKGKTYFANVRLEKVKSTVGSGDCLTAGIAWAVEKNLKPEEIAAYAVACGAANCIHKDLGMIKRQDVEMLLPKVECKILEDEC